MAYRISIDPGLGGTGLAAWDMATWDRAIPPYASHCLYVPVRGKDWTWDRRADYLRGRLDDWLPGYFNRGWRDVNQVYIEQPQFFDSGKGHASARKGSLLKLQFVVGMCAGMLRCRGVTVELVPVTTWLRQLTSRQLHPRVKILTGRSYKSHTLYAVGLGLFKKGLL